jgi:hypothetical protein
MNSRLSKRIVSPRENPPHVRRSPSAATTIEVDGAIGMIR